jgi:hypothetical protein
MDFRELLERYRQLRADFDAGKIDDEEFQDEIEGLQVKDEQGLFWTIGAQSGKWYRFDGSDWVQETPLPMTKHQGRGIPEAIARLTAPRPAGAPSVVPRWLYTGCASFLLLVVVALLVVVVANFHASVRHPRGHANARANPQPDVHRAADGDQADPKGLFQ